MSGTGDDDGMKALADEMEEAAQLSTFGWQIETGAPALNAAEQEIHDLGMTAGIAGAIEVLDRRGWLVNPKAAG